MHEVVFKLANGARLPEKYKDHKLKNFDARDCHIMPDWILLYRFDDDILYLLRTGTHSDLGF